MISLNEESRNFIVIIISFFNFLLIYSFLSTCTSHHNSFTWNMNIFVSYSSAGWWCNKKQSVGFNRYIYIVNFDLQIGTEAKIKNMWHHTKSPLTNLVERVLKKGEKISLTAAPHQMHFPVSLFLIHSSHVLP